jgi:hypothetical protein
MDNQSTGPEFIEAQKPPVKAGWMCLIAAWTFFLIPIPGVGIIGWALNLAAFIIAIIVMVKGRVGAGVVLLVCAFVVSPLIYFVGLGILGHVLWHQPRYYRV